MITIYKMRNIFEAPKGGDSGAITLQQIIDEAKLLYRKALKISNVTISKNVPQTLKEAKKLIDSVTKKVSDSRDGAQIQARAKGYANYSTVVSNLKKVTRELKEVISAAKKVKLESKAAKRANSEPRDIRKARVGNELMAGKSKRAAKKALNLLSQQKSFMIEIQAEIDKSLLDLASAKSKVTRLKMELAGHEKDLKSAIKAKVAENTIASRKCRVDRAKSDLEAAQKLVVDLNNCLAQNKQKLSVAKSDLVMLKQKVGHTEREAIDSVTGKNKALLMQSYNALLAQHKTNTKFTKEFDALIGKNAPYSDMLLYLKNEAPLSSAQKKSAIAELHGVALKAIGFEDPKLKGVDFKQTNWQKVKELVNSISLLSRLLKACGVKMNKTLTVKQETAIYDLYEAIKSKKAASKGANNVAARSAARGSGSVER